jgi:hypothetical protein
MRIAIIFCVIAAAAFMALTGAAVADTIVVDGVTYRDVKIRDSGSRYYFLTSDGTAMSVSKSAIGPREIAFGSEPLPGENSGAATATMEAPAPVSAVVSTADAVELPPPAPVNAGAATANLLRAGLGGLQANALVIESGGHLLGIVALDLAAIDEALIQRVLDRLVNDQSRLDRSNCIVAATGRFTQAQAGILQGPLEQVFFGAYAAEAAGQVASAAAEALSAAEQALAPATLHIAEAQVPQVHTSSGGDGASLDSTLTVLRATHADGAPLGYLVNFPLYPAFGPDALPGEGRGAAGALQAALGAAAGAALPVVFLNGAAADTVPGFSQGEEAVGDSLAAAALDAIAGAAPLAEAPLISVSRSTSFPPTMLEGLAPREASLLEAHLGDAIFMTVPASVSAQPGVLLRVKAMHAGKEQVFVVAHAGGFAGLIPSVDGFFAGEATEQSSFYGPLAGKWLAETYLPGTLIDPPVWQNIPELAPHAGTFAEAMEMGRTNGDAIRARYEAVSEGLAKLTGLVRNAPAMLGDKAPPELEQFMPLIEGLEDAQLQGVVKQLAAALFRSQAGDFTAEQRARLMGAAEGAGIPFDAVVLLHALADLTTLPEEAQLFVKMAQAQGGDVEGYSFF